MKLKKIKILIPLIFLASNLIAQIYPIRTQTLVTPPVPTSLEKMVSEPNRTKLSIWVDDADIADYAVKLNLHIESNGIKIYTNPNYYQQPIYLNGGETQYFEGEELSAWFDVNNLLFEGMTKNEYLKNNRLEEGTYRIWFEVVDYYRNIKVSSAIQSIALMYLTNEPSLTIPANQSEVEYNANQNIYFTWIQQASVNPETQQEFKFQLWQVLPEDRDPYEIIRTSLPVYETEVQQPSLLYDATMPLLEAGKKYCWRVQVYDAFDQEAFRNDGISNVYSFTYGSKCEDPIIKLESIDETAFKISWNSNPYADNYIVNIKRNQDEEWKSYETCNLSYSAQNLNSYQTYQAQVTAVCFDEESNASNLVEYETKIKSNYECGQPGKSVTFDNNDPLEEFLVGDYFQAYDFWIKTTKIDGSNGTFSGDGYVTVPFLGKLGLLVTFKNITLNTDKVMTHGVVCFTKEGGKSLQVGVGDLFKKDNTIDTEEALNLLDKATDDNVTVDGEISKVEVDGNTVIITTTDGKTVTKTVEEGENVKVTDNTDNVYVANTGSGGVASTNTNSTAIGGKTAKTTTASTSSECQVKFSAYSKQKYGFDQPGGQKQPEAYFNLGSDNLRRSWKSLKTGSTDYVVANINESCDSMRYAMESGMLALKEEKGNKTHHVLLTGTYGSFEDVLQAFVPKVVNDSTNDMQIDGELGVVTYDEVLLNVVLIPVNGAAVPNANVVQAGLDSIYAEAAVRWSVQTYTDGLQVSDLNNRQFIDSGTSKVSPYTSDMKLLRDEFSEETNSIDNNTLYLFFVNNNETSSIKGYMPLSYQYGFIYTQRNDASTIIKTIAHELGHGAFNLLHTFSSDAQYFITEGQSLNLMDYNDTGCDLWKYQWDLIHDPESMVFAWAKDEEEAQSASYASVSQNINRLVELIRCAYKNNSTFSFPTPAWWLLYRNVYLADVELQDGNTYRISVNFNNDVIDYMPTNEAAEIKSSFAYYYFDGITLGVKEEQYEAFEKYLFPTDDLWNGQLTVKAKEIDQLVSSENIDNAVSLLYETSNCVLAQLSYQTKFKLLKNISEKTTQEDRLDYGVVELLTSIAKDKNESIQFYKDIESSPGIITSLYKGTDDEYTTEKFINSIIIICSNYWDDKTITVSDDKTFIKYSTGYYTAKVPSISSGDETISFVKWADYFDTWADAVSCSPFEAVAIFQPAISKDGEDVYIKVPAIYLANVDITLSDKNVTEFLSGAASITGAFTGYGMIYRGASAIQKVISIVEIANAATNMVLLSDEVKNQISSTPQGIAFLEAWPTISLALDLTTIGIGTLDAFSDDALKVLDDYGDIIPDLERQRINLLAEECKIISKFADDANALFSKNIINQFADAYIDGIEAIVTKHGLSLDEFKSLIHRPVEGIDLDGFSVTPLTSTEKATVDAIRNELPSTFDVTTVFEKTIPEEVMEHYLLGTREFGYSAGGFVSRAQDVKYLDTPEKVYYGLRLDYNSIDNTFTPSNAKYKLRFTTDETSKIGLPSATKYPNTGHGFTAGSNGVLGVPELQVSGGAEFTQAAIYKILDDGTEELLGVYDAENKFFIKY